jgi:PAS domain S-box-containing protein
VAADTILIVDDNEANLKVARVALEVDGFDVRVAIDGEAALELLRSFRPRLILMDIQLPGVDGLEVTRRLKADAATRDILIIAVTAYAMKGDREKALGAGCDGYITKPLDPIHLPSQVAEYLGRTLAPVTQPWQANARPAVLAPPSALPEAADTIDRAPILLVEDNPTTRKMFRVSLETAGYRVVEAQDARTALDFAAHSRPALIIQDLVLPDMDGLDLAREFRARFDEGSVPILCVSGFLSRIDQARAMKDGFAQVLVKPVDPLQLLDVVKVHLAALPAVSAPLGAGRRLLVVDDDPLQCKLAQVWLAGAGFEVITADDGAAALALARRERPVVIVSDVLMPKMDGYALCLALRRDASTADIPVILNSSAYVEDADQRLAARVGASALLAKSDGLENVMRAVSAALSGAPPPVPSEPLELLDEEHARRALWQLERQVQQNARLLQRTALQQAQLAVLAGVAEALAKHQVLNGVLGDVLAACLDMAGISKGALYTTEGSERMLLTHQIGFSEAEVPRLRTAFGCEALFLELARHGKVVLIPSAAVPADLTQQLIVEVGTTSLLLVPVAWANTTFGAMLLGARTADIAGEDALAFARVLGAQMGQAIGLARSFSRLADSELRYRTLTENAHDSISVLTLDGVIREVNRRLTEAVGYSADQMIGRHIRDFAALGRDEINVQSNGQTVAAGSGRTPPVEIRKADGSTVLMEFSNAAVDVGGEQLVFSIGRDVTEQVRAQAQLMVSDRMASVGTLAAGVAHEINNPLAVVLGNLELAVRAAVEMSTEANVSPRLTELQESLHDARDAAQRVREIVRDLKIFSRAEEDRRTAVDVQRVLESTLRMAWTEIRHRARLVKTYGKVPCVDANESRLGQVFLNLIVNAAQAIPEGHANANEIRVTTGTDAAGRVVVEVRDTGPGMAPETLKMLFTPFFTTKPAGVGTGLGLIICQRIVNGLGGEITAESRPGSGTVMRVALPAAQGNRVEEAPAAIEPPAAARRGRVLVVDDDKRVGAMLHNVLSDEHDVEVLASAKEALERLSAGQRYDVILCDMMMPVVSGMDFYEVLRDSAGEQADRIVFLTGGAFTARAREFLDRVPNTSLEKPFKLRDLRALINARIQ